MKPLFYYRFLSKYIYKNLGCEWDALAPNKSEADAFASKYLNPEPSDRDDLGNLTAEYILASSGETINRKLRAGENNAILDDLSQMVSNHKTQRPHVLYRGICFEVFKQMTQNATPFKGIDLYEKSFMQCSLVRGSEHKANLHLRIYVPEGIEAIYLGNIADNLKSYEVAIQRGVGLKIISIDQKYINCRLTMNGNKFFSYK